MKKRKVCAKCGLTLTVDSFYKQAATKDGLRTYCKICSHRCSVESRHRNLKECRKREKLSHREWLKDPIAKGKRQASIKKWLTKERRRAIKLVSRKLIRPRECSLCGEACKPQGHHEDYSRPLNVIWCCIPCHKQMHRDKTLILSSVTS